MTIALQTKYVFTIAANIGGVTSAGDIGHGDPLDRPCRPRRDRRAQKAIFRHCERSEAIHGPAREERIASLRSQ
jgi:hypothetical protein